MLGAHIGTEAIGERAVASGGTLLWERDGNDWPNREASIFPWSGGLRWHVQRAGRGPALLLLHGTGSATHSWRDLMPTLARSFTVIAPDLPGHGFTQMPPFEQLSLPGMSKAIADLLNVLGVEPAYAAGHSAGAAILARMSLSRYGALRTIVSLNGALLPLGGIGGIVFSPLAKVLARTPLLPWLFAQRAEDPTAVARLLKGTGSTLDARGVELYTRLIRNPQHVAAALGMMANWNLRALQRDLPFLQARLVQIVGRQDLTIPALEAYRVRDILPSATVEVLPGLGHLAHEEQPALVAQRMESAFLGDTRKAGS